MKNCGLCGRAAFPPETVAAFGQVWHHTCFVCTVPLCGKTLDSLTACEHKQTLFCQHCYKRNVGQQQTYHGLRPTVTHISSAEEAAYSYKVYDEKSVLRRKQFKTDYCNDQLKPEPKKAAVVPIVDQIFGNRICPKCEKTVYEAEKISAAGQTWHKNTCFTCLTCEKRLESRSLCERKGQLFCNVCYGKQFGPRIYGHGSSFINVL
ncbi:hypothetical protein L596_003586 [Steinernema carpocapsae]|uniref:Cysteine-rich protein 1 n=1 Tax=Steinernema carpocapsae TaxID=34508 RepID=A0A4U8UX26_STECR|nr:hypothetical protein L596_003586 [Steinernema carpocapsae]